MLLCIKYFFLYSEFCFSISIYIVTAEIFPYEIKSITVISKANTKV